MVYLDQDAVLELVYSEYMGLDSLYSWNGFSLTRIEEESAEHSLSMIPGEGLFDIVYNGQPNDRIRSLNNGAVSEVWAGIVDWGNGATCGAPDLRYYTFYSSEEDFSQDLAVHYNSAEARWGWSLATMSYAEIEAYLSR